MRMYNGKPPMSRYGGILLILLALSAVIFTMNIQLVKAGASYSLIRKWGSPGGYIQPNGVTVDTNGNMYIADVANSAVEKLSASGALVAYWGSNGTGHGQFQNPKGIALDP